MIASKQEKTRGVLKNGNPRHNGRPKGSKNKFTTLKQAFLDAFERTGGAQGLIEWINENKRNRAVFYQLITKLFPQEVEHFGGVEVDAKVTIEVVHVKPKESK